ncbi:hypothetical protein LCGC14_0231320 [marine sediment metagenome]|uniref:Uncharacterized protein n=1 Tax=marine sediment metagenome TaxID=412755 RepID=A0A0F9UA01_9ZZZZ
MSKGKNSSKNFKGDGKQVSHRGHKYWTHEERQGHEAFQRDIASRKADREARRESRRQVRETNQ